MNEVLVMDRAERETFWLALDSGYKILFTADVESGLKMLSKNVDLVFLNMELQGLNNVDVPMFIKKEYPSIALITIASCEEAEACPEVFKKDKENNSTALKAEEVLQKIKSLLSMNDLSKKPESSYSDRAVPYESHPDVPSHLVNGVLRVRDFIDRNYAESLTLAEACRIADMSKTYFCRFFKCITGHSLRSYEHYVKIRAAGEFLKDKGLSIKDIALKVGYSDPNYFSTVYKKITGASPRQRQVYNPESVEASK